MKRLTFALALMLGIAVQGAQLPRPAGDITIVEPGGKQIKPSDYKGKVLILVFILTT